MMPLFEPAGRQIVLDQQSLKALASDTRMAILKSFEERKWNVSELSRKLEMSKSTIHGHLNKLEDAGLIEKEPNTSKWVYYSLSRKGKNIIYGKSDFVVMITSIFGFLSGMLLLYLSSFSNLFATPVQSFTSAVTESKELTIGAGTETASDTVANSIVPIVEESLIAPVSSIFTPELQILLVMVGIVMVGLSIVLFYRSKK